MAIMILKERGVLNYDDKVDSYLKDFPYDNISVRNLLNHTSGLPDYSNLLERYWGVENSNRSVASQGCLCFTNKVRTPAGVLSRQCFPVLQHWLRRSCSVD